MRIETKKVNNNQIIAEVDNEDNSIDIAVMIDDEPLVTFNISLDEEKVLLRKWIGYGDSIDEDIYLDEVDEN